MADFWNQRAMQPPATCNIPYSAEEQREEKVIQSLQVVVEVLAAFHSTSEAYKSLSVESHVLSGLIYRSNNQFRSDKRLQLMKRIDQCLKRNAALKIVDLAIDLQQCFPGQGVCDFHPHFSSAVYIPSRQMYQHLLVKCVGSAALLGRCASLCIEAFLMARQMLALGHFLQNMSVLAANLSRIWVLCRHLGTQINVLYKQLIAVVEHLKPVDTPWMPKEASLPADLSHFLLRRADMENVEEMMEKASLERDDGEQHGIDYSEDEDDENMEPHDNEDKDLGVEIKHSQVDDEDVGLPVIRDEDLGLPIKRDCTIKDALGKNSRNIAREDERIIVQRDYTNQNTQQSNFPKSKKRKKSDGFENVKKRKVDHQKQGKKRKLGSDPEAHSLKQQYDPSAATCGNSIWFEDRKPDTTIKKKVKMQSVDQCTNSSISLSASVNDHNEDASIKKKTKKKKSVDQYANNSDPSYLDEHKQCMFGKKKGTKHSTFDDRQIKSSNKKEEEERLNSGDLWSKTDVHKNVVKSKKEKESTVSAGIQSNIIKASKKKKKRQKKNDQAE